MASFDGIATVVTSGGTAPYQYVWNDSNSQTDSMAVYLNPGWYEVLVTDVNGCSITDSIYLGAASIADLGDLTPYFYPNPTTSNIQITVPNAYLNSSYYLTSENGKTLRNGTFSSMKTVLDLTDLSSGIYFLKTEGGVTLKIVKAE
jgi:hypothetical protein